MNEAIDIASAYTKSGRARLKAMASALQRIDREGIAGDIVECGVWQGGNIVLARLLSPERVCWLYDTFEGMTEPSDRDVTRSGRAAMTSYKVKQAEGRKWAAASAETVRDNLKAAGAYEEHKLRFIEGPVERTLTGPDNLPARLALLRLDTDWYASTKIEMQTLYPLLSPGGVLIIDDYGHWMGARAAVDEYFAPAMPELEMIDYTGAMMVKPC